MKKIPFIRPDLYLDEDVAVVGSANNLLHSKQGSEIDSHKEVIRFNRATTLGFEEDVGKKVTLRCINLHVLKASPDIRGDIEQPGRNFIKELRNAKVLVDCEPKVLLQNSDNLNESLEIFHSNRWVSQNSLDWKIPIHMSMGCFIVSLLVQSGIISYCFGFGDRNDTENLTGHYGWNKPKEKSVCHNFQTEHQLLLKMESEGKIIFHG